VAGDPRRDPLQRRLLASFRPRDPLIVLPYLGYGAAGKATLCGRVLQVEGFRATLATERRWRNLAAFVKRMESDEVPGARVRATFQGRSSEAVTNREGYFHFDLPGPKRAGWHDVALELVSPQAGARATGQVIVPAASADFGVISDIDDTLVASGATRKLSMIVRLALSNALTRKPFSGVGAFYRALHRGANPLFYVSKSPWNLYLPLVEMMRAQRIPLGPLMLRDYGLHLARRGRLGHKAVQIERILGTYAKLPFVLIGDSGEEDPEIYSEVVRRHPGRVLAIYIRAIEPDAGRLAAIARLAAEVKKTRCQLVLAPDTAFAGGARRRRGLHPPRGPARHPGRARRREFGVRYVILL
jgi:phosphatidate phosphatase APP1